MTEQDAYKMSTLLPKDALFSLWVACADAAAQVTAAMEVVPTSPDYTTHLSDDGNALSYDD